MWAVFLLYQTDSDETDQYQGGGVIQPGGVQRRVGFGPASECAAAETSSRLPTLSTRSFEKNEEHYTTVQLLVHDHQQGSAALTEHQTWAGWSLRRSSSSDLIPPFHGLILGQKKKGHAWQEMTVAQKINCQNIVPCSWPALRAKTIHTDFERVPGKTILSVSVQIGMFDCEWDRQYLPLWRWYLSARQRSVCRGNSPNKHPNVNNQNHTNSWRWSHRFSELDVDTTLSTKRPFTGWEQVEHMSTDTVTHQTDVRVL